MKDENKQAYSFTEKALQRGPSIEAPPNAVHTGDAVQNVILFAATTQRTIEAAIAVLKNRGVDTESPEALFNRVRKTDTEDLVELFTPCLEAVFREAKRRCLLKGLQEGGARTAGVRRPRRHVRRSS